MSTEQGDSASDNPFGKACTMRVVSPRLKRFLESQVKFLLMSRENICFFKRAESESNPQIFPLTISEWSKGLASTKFCKEIGHLKSS